MSGRAIRLQEKEKRRQLFAQQPTPPAEKPRTLRQLMEWHALGKRIEITREELDSLPPGDEDPVTVGEDSDFEMELIDEAERPEFGRPKLGRSLLVLCALSILWICTILVVAACRQLWTENPQGFWIETVSAANRFMSTTVYTIVLCCLGILFVAMCWIMKEKQRVEMTMLVPLFIAFLVGGLWLTRSLFLWVVSFF